MGKSSAVYIGGRCVHEWLPNSSCKLCVEACPTNAVKLDGKRPTIDADRCTLCGACMRICPTEALIASPPYTEIAQRIPISDGVAELACGRDVNCIAHIDDSVILALRSRGATRIVVRACRRCPRGADVHSEATRLAELGAEVVNDLDAPMGEVGIRQSPLLSLLAKYLRNPAIIKREGVALVRGVPEKRELLLKSLDYVDDNYVSRRFVGKHIDIDACEYMGTCAALCPTGALRDDGRGRITFSPSICVACRVCLEACVLGAIRNVEVDPGIVRRGTRVELARFRLRRCRECGQLFASKHGEELCPQCRGINRELADIFGPDARLEKGF